MDRDDAANELERLRKSEKHYRILMDESMDPTFSFYADGTYRYVNKAFARGVGKALDEIIGHKIWDVFDKDEADKRFGVVKRVFAEGNTEEIEFEAQASDTSGFSGALTTGGGIQDQERQRVENDIEIIGLEVCNPLFDCTDTSKLANGDFIKGASQIYFRGEVVFQASPVYTPPDFYNVDIVFDYSRCLVQTM